MAKILIAFGEHDEETAFGRARSNQLKRILEQREFGHEVEVTEVEEGLKMHELAERVHRAKGKEEAFKILEETVQKMKSERQKYDSYLIAQALASSHPGAHVFSMHVHHYLPTAREPEPEAEARPSRVLGVIGHSVKQRSLDASLHEGTPLWGSSAIRYGTISRGNKLQGVGIVENLAVFHDYANRKGKKAEKFRKRLQEFLQRLEAFNAEKPPKDETESKIRGVIKYETRRLMEYSSASRRHWHMKEEHALALAKKIHELVSEAERGRNPFERR